MVLLSNEKCITKTTIINYPTNNETISAITVQKYELARNEIMCNKVNELNIVKKLVSTDDISATVCRKLKSICDQLFNRASEKRNTHWAYPSSKDIQVAKKEQILNCKVESEYNLNDSQIFKYVLQNSNPIIRVFNEQ